MQLCTARWNNKKWLKIDCIYCLHITFVPKCEIKELLDWSQGLAEYYNEKVESLRPEIKTEADDELNRVYYHFAHEAE